MTRAGGSGGAPGVQPPLPPVATFSAVAHDRTTGQWGVAVASKFLAVGSIVPWAEAGAGAVATQSYANPRYGPDGLALLRGGAAAADVVAALTGADDGRDQRQLGVVDARGGAAAFTGAGCHDWAGHRTGECWAVQGNLLAGPQVLDGMAAVLEGALGVAGTGGWKLAEVLLEALAAGDAAGGDARGR